MTVIKTFTVSLFLFLTSFLCVPQVIAEHKTDKYDFQVIQLGEGNALVLESLQSAHNQHNVFNLRQDGELNSVAMLLETQNSFISLLQQGQSNQVLGELESGDSLFSIIGEDVSFNVSQMGALNRVAGYIHTDQVQVNISQQGTGNTAIVRID